MRTFLGLVCWALALAAIPFIEPPADGLTILALALIALGGFILWPESNDNDPSRQG